MRVLMIGPDRSVHGGISGVVNNYYEAGLDQQIELCYIGTMVEGSKVRKFWQATTAMFRFLGKLPHYEIVHINVASDASYYRKSYFIRAAHFFHKKIVIHQHGGDFETFYYKELSEKGRRKVQRVLSMGDVFLVLAPAWKEFFGKIIDKRRIIVFPDAIQIPKKCHKEYGKHRILFLGRICKEKGIRELLTAVRNLKEKYPDLLLYLGGIFEDQELAEIVEKQSECTKWLGWIAGEEKKKYLQECDCFVLPSYFEGQSVSILEAMAYSSAIVAADTGGIPQMIQHEENGLLIPPRDEKALEEALDRLLSDSACCSRLGEAARAKVEQDFSMDENIKKLLAIYGRLSKE